MLLKSESFHLITLQSAINHVSKDCKGYESTACGNILKNEAYPEVRKTAIHRKSTRERSQKWANVHRCHVQMSVFTAL